MAFVHRLRLRKGRHVEIQPTAHLTKCGSIVTRITCHESSQVLAKRNNVEDLAAGPLRGVKARLPSGCRSVSRARQHCLLVRRTTAEDKITEFFGHNHQHTSSSFGEVKSRGQMSLANVTSTAGALCVTALGAHQHGEVGIAHLLANNFQCSGVDTAKLHASPACGLDTHPWASLLQTTMPHPGSTSRFFLGYHVEKLLEIQK